MASLTPLPPAPAGASCSRNLSASQVVLVVNNPTANAGDVRDAGSIPGPGRSSPGYGGHSNPLQYSCLENLMDRGAWWATIRGSQRVEHH